jgi:predicted nucleotidyltransferase
MLDKIEIINRLKKSLKLVLGDKIRDVILFGSYLRNEENEFSDLDILIVTNSILSWEEKSIARDVCADLSIDNDVLIDSKIISQHEIKNNFWGKHPLITDALKAGAYAK